MQLEIPDADGVIINFECEDTFVSSWVSKGILSGSAYPDLGFVGTVETIVDVGANCGAASVYFARRHPSARVHAIEPGSRQRAILERNVADLANVTIHPIGLHSADQTTPLYFGDGDSGMSSVIPGPFNTDEHEVVTLRNAQQWADDTGIGTIDLLKIDVEGCEVDVIESFQSRLADVKVLYVEYDSRAARRRIAELVEPTHELFIGKIFLDQGECTYLRSDLADDPGAIAWLRSIFEK